MTPEIESAFAHLLDPRCRLCATDRRLELARLREMVREAWPQPSVTLYPAWEWSPPNDRGMRVPGGHAV